MKILILNKNNNFEVITLNILSCIIGYNRKFNPFSEKFTLYGKNCSEFEILLSKIHVYLENPLENLYNFESLNFCDDYLRIINNENK